MGWDRFDDAKLNADKNSQKKNMRSLIWVLINAWIIDALNSRDRQNYWMRICPGDCHGTCSIIIQSFMMQLKRSSGPKSAARPCFYNEGGHGWDLQRGHTLNNRNKGKNNVIDVVDALVGALANNSRLRKLNLSFQDVLSSDLSITARGCQSLANLLENPNCNLEDLSLRGMSLVMKGHLFLLMHMPETASWRLCFFPRIASQLKDGLASPDEAELTTESWAPSINPSVQCQMLLE